MQWPPVDSGGSEDFRVLRAIAGPGPGVSADLGQGNAISKPDLTLTWRSPEVGKRHDVVKTLNVREDLMATPEFFLKRGCKLQVRYDLCYTCSTCTGS